MYYIWAAASQLLFTVHRNEEACLAIFIMVSYVPCQRNSPSSPIVINYDLSNMNHCVASFNGLQERQVKYCPHLSKYSYHLFSKLYVNYLAEEIFALVNISKQLELPDIIAFSWFISVIKPSTRVAQQGKCYYTYLQAVLIYHNLKHVLWALV